MSRLHHLAIVSRDVQRLASFYQSLFALAEVARHDDASGQLRSIWLELDGPLLMIERGEAGVSAAAAPELGLVLLALRVSPQQRAAIERELERRGVAIERRTAYTSYARDPDGNRFAFSHYPEPQVDERRDFER